MESSAQQPRATSRYAHQNPLSWQGWQGEYLPHSTIPPTAVFESSHGNTDSWEPYHGETYGRHRYSMSAFEARRPPEQLSDTIQRAAPSCPATKVAIMTSKMNKTTISNPLHRLMTTPKCCQKQSSKAAQQASSQHAASVFTPPSPESVQSSPSAPGNNLNTARHGSKLYPSP